MSNTNKPRTYYGPWIHELPGDAPNGSLWQGLHKVDNRTHDFVVVGGEFHHERDGLDAEWCQQFRRVWPPGSVVPEPRPFVVDGKVQSMEQSEWWMISSTRTGGAYWHMTERGYHNWLSQKPEMQEGALYYPVQHLANQAMVAIPWQDQIGEVGE